MMPGNLASTQASNTGLAELPTRNQTITGDSAARFDRAAKILAVVTLTAPSRNERPDRVVAGIAQTHILDVCGLMPRFAKPASECRRQLGVDEKDHLASESTAWSTCAAAY